MSLDFRIFVEVQQTDGYGITSWSEVNSTTGFLDGYCPDYDGYLTEELFIGLSTIKDGYFSRLFKKNLPVDLSRTVRYKIEMLSYLGSNKTYCLTLEEINAFDWSRKIYDSWLTNETTFYDVATDFLLYYVTALNSLGLPDKVRLIVFKKG